MTENSVLEKAAKLCLKNARQYIKDAEVLYLFQSYGHALALTVLGDVELGKASMYALWSKDLIAGETLPPPIQTYFWEKKYGLFASKTWFAGLVLASNIEELVQELLDASEEAGEVAAEGGEISAVAIKRINEIIKKMKPETAKLFELEEQRAKGSFVDFSVRDATIITPDTVQKAHVKNRIRKSKLQIKRSTPFLSISLSKVPKRIARILVEEAIITIFPLSDRISQFVMPVMDQTEEIQPTWG